MGFTEPDETGGVRINPADVVGHLLLVWAVDYIPHSPTQYTRPDRPSDVIVVDAVDLDQVDPDTGMSGLLGRKCWWRQAQLIAAMKSKIGNPDCVLVRMERGRATKGMPPFVLTSCTSEPQAVQRANAWFQRNPGFVPSVPGPKVEEAELPARDPHQQVLRDATEGIRHADQQQTILEQMAQRATLPPPSPHNQSDQPPY